MKFIFIMFFVITALFSVEGIKSIENLETEISMQKWSDSNFGLEPYRVNYL